MSERPLALTMGEPAGIGPEIAITAWHERHERGTPPFILIADANFIAQTAHERTLAVPVVETKPEDVERIFPLALPVMALDFAVAGRPGRPNAADAPAVVEAIRMAVSLTAQGRTRAVVTNPIAKSVLSRAGFPHPGHTEFLGELAVEYFNTPSTPVMLLWSNEVAAVPVTVHVPFIEVADLLTTQKIVETTRILAHDLSRRFGLSSPKIAVAGLNPHAGESGTLGREEITIIAPAIATLQAEGIDVTGPFPADTLFHAKARAHYDAVVAMYHDQALIPVKTLAFDRAVNVTLGLPFVRTSPDHGTAFDIAGTGQADPSSLVAALKLAHRLSRHEG